MSILTETTRSFKATRTPERVARTLKLLENTIRRISRQVDAARDTTIKAALEYRVGILWDRAYTLGATAYDAGLFPPMSLEDEFPDVDDGNRHDEQELAEIGIVAKGVDHVAL